MSDQIESLIKATLAASDAMTKVARDLSERVRAVDDEQEGAVVGQSTIPQLPQLYRDRVTILSPHAISTVSNTRRTGVQMILHRPHCHDSREWKLVWTTGAEISVSSAELQKTWGMLIPLRREN